MSMNPDLAELKKRHEELSSEIEAIERRPGYEHLEVAALKKQNCGSRKKSRGCPTRIPTRRDTVRRRFLSKGIHPQFRSAFP